MNEWHKNILEQSSRIADSRWHSHVHPEHLLLAILKDEEGLRGISGVVANEMDIAGMYTMLTKHIDHDMNLVVDKKNTQPPEITATVQDILYRGEGRSLAYDADNLLAADRKTLPPAVGVLLEILHRDDTYAAECLKTAGVKADDLMNFIELGPKVSTHPGFKPPKPPRFS